MLEYKEKSLLMPRFIRERSVKRVLQNLYVTMVGSSTNAEILLSQELAKIDADMVAGNPLVRRCFLGAKRWLLRMQEFASSYEVFTDQFLEPARCPARFLLNVREITPSTTQLTGLVISKSSPFFDKYFEDKISSITIVVPEIETVMSLRCRLPIAENVQHGFYTLKRVQPIPLVNRIHPISNQELDLKPKTEKLSLVNLNFLKISFSDFSLLSKSMIFENYCEIWTEQKERRILGFPFIICGRVISAGTGPNITLQSIQNPGLKIDLHVTECLLRFLETDLYGLKDLRGKPVRALVVDWYRYDFSKILPEYPEILALEYVDESEILVDDLIGFVRLRDKVDLRSLRMRYPTVKLQELPPPIVLEGEGLALYSHCYQGGDAIIDAFAKEKNRLTSLRRKITPALNVPNALMSARCLLDIEKLRLAAFSERMRNDKVLLHSFLCLIREKDQKGSLPKSVRGLAHAITGATSEMVNDKLWWLIDIGFLSKTKDGTRIAKEGITVAYLATNQDIKRILKHSPEPLISVLKLQENTSLPTTLLLQAMYELEKEGTVKPLRVGGHKCELFWIVCSENEKDAEARALILLQRMEKEVIRILKEVPHSLSDHKILEKMREKGINLDLRMLRPILTGIEAMDKIKRRDNSWFYPWENRILDLLHENPSAAFTFDEILSKTSIPPVKRDIVHSILNELCEKNQITKILGDKWTACPPDKETILKSECKAVIMKTILDHGRRMSLEKLKIDWHLRTSIMDIKGWLGFRIGTENLINQLLEEMAKEKTIIIHNGFVEVITKHQLEMR